jgi:hypothetical protein
MTAPPQPPAWYPDPGAAGALRWWDGTAWTQHVAPAHPVFVPVRSTDGLAIASLITALMGIPIVPIVLGFVARGRIERSGGRSDGNGLAMAGIVIGFIQIVIGIAFIALLIAGFAAIDTQSGGFGSAPSAASDRDAIDQRVATFEEGLNQDDGHLICFGVFSAALASSYNGTPQTCERRWTAIARSYPDVRLRVLSAAVDGDHARAKVKLTARRTGQSSRNVYDLVRAGDGWRIDSEPKRR